MPKKPIEAERPIIEPKQELIKAKKPRKEPFGRPTLYNQEIANRICELVATHPYGLPTLCKMFPEIPCQDTINRWRWRYKDFSENYTNSKRFQAELMAESIEDIIAENVDYVYQDENNVNRLDAGILGLARLKVDSRKWVACKLAPKIYGDKVTHEGNITINHEMALKELE